MKSFRVDLYEYFNLKKDEGNQGYLDCYILNNSDEISLERKHPAMLILGGGGYRYVSDREQEPIVFTFLQNDYNVFMLKYSCVPATFPTSFIEASMAMAYIRENAQKLNVNENAVAGIGFSAGGHLLGTISTMFNRHELDFLGERKAYVKPDASLFIYPVVTGVNKAHIGSFKNLLGDNYETRSQELSIENNVTKDCPPAFIVSTFGDNVVPCKNSLLLACAYENAGVPFALHVFEKGRHGLSLAQKTVYGTALWEEVKGEVSSDFYKWPKMALAWLKDRGFKSIDE